MQCPQCQFDNPPQMKFCGQCGTRLQILCSQCGAEIPPGFKFCGQCGTPLAPQAAPAPATPEVPPTAPTPTVHSTAPTPTPSVEPPKIVAEAPQTASPARPEGEIKQVTVLSAELSCQTSSGEPLDAERTHQLLNRFVELARSETERYGGTLKPPSGMGLMALFGAPIAHEDHTRRAVLTALALRQRMRELDAEVAQALDAAWSVRVGIDTGSVIVGGVGDMAVGEATIEAGRLQQAALADEIVASPRLRDLVEDQFRWQEVESSSGRPSAWRVVEQRSESQIPHRWRGGGRLSPFVGRERELTVLQEALDQAAEGRGQIVGLAGEAGAGKSRLLYELRRSLSDRPAVYLRGQCLSYGSGVPYLPLVDMIRRASRIGDNDPPDVVTEKMHRSLEVVGTDPEPSMPFFLRLLGVRAGTEELQNLEPLAIQNRTFAAMRRMILNAAQKNLVIMELEDLHWIDDTSASFIESLIEVMTAARLLLLLTYRTGYQPSWSERSYATQLSLRRLADKDSQAIVQGILEETELPEDVVSNVLGKAEGNPFFLEELSRALAEHRKNPDGKIPDTVQGVLMARLDSLPEAHKHLLQTSSVLGRDFTLDLLTALWENDTPLDGLLEDLQRWEFLYRSPTEDQEAYFFKHALIQEVAYQSLLGQRREALHAKAGETLEELYADRLEDAYARLIYHYPKASRPEKAMHYLVLFAAQAASNNTHAEAARALREALTHAERLGTEDRDRVVIEVLLKLAESLLPLAHFPETLELLEKYRSVLEGLEDEALKARFFFWLAHTHTYLGNQEETRENAEISIDAAKACGDEAIEGKACYVLGRDGFWSGLYQQGVENSLRAVVLLERSGEPWWQGQAYWVAGFNHFALGQFDQALESLERAREIGEALDDYRLDTSWSIGYVLASMGEAAKGVEECKRGLERMQDPLNTGVAMGFLGYAYLENGDVEMAVQTLEQSLAGLEETGMKQLLGWFMAFLAEAFLRAGRIKEAGESRKRSLALCEEARFQYGMELAGKSLSRA